MKNFLASIRASASEFRRTQTIAMSGMLTAINVVLHFTTVQISNLSQIRFSFLAVAATGFLYGPIVGGIMGAVGDLLKYLIYPTGPFFPGFTFNEFVAGFIYGIVLYRHKATILRTIVAQSIKLGVISFGLLPLWLCIMYGNSYIVIVSANLVKNLILFPIETVLLFFILKLVQKIPSPNRR